MYTLTICFGIYLGICGQVRQFDYPSLEACERERAAQLAGPNKPYYAICAPKQEPK